MGFFKNTINKINRHFLLRNIVLAICGVLVFVFVVNLLLNIFTRHGQQYEVPDLVGSTIYGSGNLTDAADLELVAIDSLYVAGQEPGAILDQDPKPSSLVKSGRKVFVVINAVNPREDVIPYVTGYSLRQAKNMLEGEGFQIERLVYRSDMANNNVIGESYQNREITKNEQTSAPLGSGIVLTVGRSATAPLPVIPKVIGLSLREAKSRLWEVGLNVGDVRRDANVTDRNLDEALVYKQSPGQQTRIDYGARITLYMTLDTKKVTESSKQSDADVRKIPEDPETEDITPEELEELLAE